MPYIGKTELKSSDVVADSFTGNGSTTAFTLSKVPPSEQAVLVSINGVKQHTDAYSISGTTLTLSAAPDSGDAIEAVSIIDIGEAAGDSLPTQTGNSGKFLTTDGADSSWSDLSLGDNVKAQFGADDDLKIYHDGSHGRIRNSTGTLKIQATANGENGIELTPDGKTALFHDGSEKLATTSTGIDITGSVTATEFNIAEWLTSTNVLETNAAGQTGARLRAAVSDADTPTFSFNDDTDTGIYTSGSNTLNFSTGGTERLRINSTGVGIGTTSPSAGLVVNNSSGAVITTGNIARQTYTGVGNLQVNTSGSGGILIHTGNTASGYLTFGDGTTSGRIEYNHSDNSMRLSTNTLERLRITSSGKVGIGVSSPSATLHLKTVSNTDAIRVTDDNGNFVARLRNSDGAVNAGWLYLYGSGSEKVRISASSGYDTYFNAGNKVGIGTSSPSQKLHVVGKGQFTDDVILSGSSPRLDFNNYLRMYSTSSGAERLRIDSSGNVLVGTTSPVNSNSRIASHVAGGGLAIETKPSSDNYYPAVFYNSSGATAGYIWATASATSYNTSSDYRLKENVVPMTGSIDRLKALNPSRFNFIVDADTTVDGFLAHEAQEVVPECVTGTKDAMMTQEYEVTPAVEAITDEEGNVTTEAVEAVMGEREVPDMQGIDQSKLVPLLVSALQEAVARIEVLESQQEQ